MQEVEPRTERTTRTSSRRLRRSIVAAAILLALVLIALIVPFLNVNRFQRRIISSLSESLGRPIHLDRISLTVLPLPGLTIENLVVAEDPAFGAEPFVRASAVRATLRISSLWRRRVEFTRISFTDPSINLVKRSNGKWNVESILLQAAHIDAAPTAQTRASSTARFPYIEASGARFNLKLDQVKTPISLTEADFALWLHSPQEWRLRLDGRPLRTDITAAEIGTVRLEGTLGRAAALGDVPVDLRAEWRNAPLGETSRALFGRDAGLRGTMTIVTTLQGKIARGTLQNTLHLTDLRRADFVPVHTLSLDLECQSTETESFHTLEDLRCSWPPALAAGPKTLALTGTLPSVRDLTSSSFDIGTPGIPAETLLEWLHIASARVSPGIAATGTLRGSLALRPAPLSPLRWSGQLTFTDGTVTIPSIAAEPVFTGDIVLHSPTEAHQSGSPFTLAPVSLALGGHDFATLEGRFDPLGYTFHLTGIALPHKLLSLGAALPILGDGLPEAFPSPDILDPVRFDLTSVRLWGGPQTWTNSRAAVVSGRRKRRERN